MNEKKKYSKQDVVDSAKVKVKVTLDRESAIVANCIISTAEIASGMNTTQAEVKTLAKDHPVQFLSILHSLGMRTDRAITKQSNLWHRTRFNTVAFGDRWVGEERQDDEWIDSGYASREAVDKSKANRIVEDLYRSRWLTSDAQKTLEDRDRHTVLDETQWMTKTEATVWFVELTSGYTI